MINVVDLSNRTIYLISCNPPVTLLLTHLLLFIAKLRSSLPILCLVEIKPAYYQPHPDPLHGKVEMEMELGQTIIGQQIPVGWSGSLGQCNIPIFDQLEASYIFSNDTHTPHNTTHTRTAVHFEQASHVKNGLTAAVVRASPKLTEYRLKRYC